MKCPKCGMNMSKDSQHIFCTHCGYLDDGKQIHGYEEKKASDLEIYLGKNFDKMSYHKLKVTYGKTEHIHSSIL